ncbi:uncharacterized protein LOC125237340 [Leguminivora glycinivorella]|uniref:uncharacterized protein LOC125237340 n=1 Tax=Leguminivora glycinivorella TaxID=1035111 RepID=UPI00200CE724|nr:uncharacterized protein LOC125237340 [Leguminivora glycinivorella]
MSSSAQIFVFALLACIVTAHSAKLSNFRKTDIVPVEKEGRILVVPTLGDVIFTGIKVTWFVISSAWSLVGYKLAAITLLANVGIWIAHNCLHAIIGAAVTLAFCKLTGKCTLDYVEYEPEYALAAKHLADGTAKYTS